MTDTQWRGPAVRGLGAGAAAWFAGYLVTYVLHADSVTNALATDVLSALADEQVTWKLVGWLYYNGQFVDSVVPGLFGQNAVNVVSGADDLALTGLVAVAPVLLLLGGLVAARGATDLGDGAKRGALVALGYLPVAVAGAFLVRVSVGDAVAGPELVTAVLLAGLAYPLVFGAVGGAARRFAQSRLAG